MTKKDIKELPNFIDASDIIKLTDFLDKYHVNYKIVENRVETDTVKLDDRGITHLPESIGNLQCERLWLDNNKLTSLPESIGNLQCENLYLYNNKLTSLPDSFGNLKCENLYLYNNELTSESKELLEKLKSNGLYVIY